MTDIYDDDYYIVVYKLLYLCLIVSILLKNNLNKPKKCLNSCSIFVTSPCNIVKYVTWKTDREGVLKQMLP